MDVLVGSLISILEPVMVVVLGVIVGFIVIALFSPMISLIQNGQLAGEEMSRVDGFIKRRPVVAVPPRPMVAALCGVSWFIAAHAGEDSHWLSCWW